MGIESSIAEPTKEEETRFNDGDAVKYKDGRIGRIVGEEGDLHLGKGLINVNFENDDNKVEGVRVSDLEKIEAEEIEEE